MADQTSDVEKLSEAIREELAYLWDDLDKQRRAAIRPGTWTIGCESIEYRIKQLTSIVGVTPWEQIQIPLLELGIYQRIHADLGIDAPVDMDKVADTRRYIDRCSAVHRG